MFGLQEVKILKLSFIATILVFVASCDNGSKSNRRVMAAADQSAENASPEPASPENTPVGPGATDTKNTGVKDLTANFGMRSYAQINATMASLTGVPQTTEGVKTAFNNLSSSLPTDNDIKVFIGSHQVAVFKLAVEYCDVLMKDQTRRSQIFGTFNFSRTPAQALNAAGKQQIADILVERFWGRDLSSLPPHAESVAMVVKLMDDILQGKNLNSASVTLAVVTGVCTGVLASAPVTLL